MRLDIFNNLFKPTKDNEKIKNFINELGEFLEKNSERNITANYKDKINIARGNIVNDYAKNNSNRGKLYFIYSKSPQREDIYNSSIYENGKCIGTIKINEKDLPIASGVNSILREKNGIYILDKHATEQIQKEISKKTNSLLEEQSKELSKKRVEGHIYKFVEKSGEIASLIDKTDYSGECFEEISFPVELLNNAKEGDMFKYINGEYIKYN